MREGRRIGIGALLSGTASLLCTLGLVTALNQGNAWSAFWLFIGAVGFGVEAYTVQHPRKGDTLSETVVARTRPLWIRIPLAVFLVWLTIHLVFDV